MLPLTPAPRPRRTPAGDVGSVRGGRVAASIFASLLVVLVAVEPGQGLLDAGDVQAEAGERPVAVLELQQGEQDVLGADVVVARAAAPARKVSSSAFLPGASNGMSAGSSPPEPAARRQPPPDRLRRPALRRERAPGEPVLARCSSPRTRCAGPISRCRPRARLLLRGDDHVAARGVNRPKPSGAEVGRLVASARSASAPPASSRPCCGRSRSMTRPSAGPGRRSDRRGGRRARRGARRRRPPPRAGRAGSPGRARRMPSMRSSSRMLARKRCRHASTLG